MKRLVIALAMAGLFSFGQAAMARGPVRRVVGYGYGYGVRPVVTMAPRVVAPVTRAVRPRVVAPVTRAVAPVRRVYAAPVYAAPVYGYRAWPGYYSTYPYYVPRRGAVVLY